MKDKFVEVVGETVKMLTPAEHRKRQLAIGLIIISVFMFLAGVMCSTEHPIGIIIGVYFFVGGFAIARGIYKEMR